MYILIALILHSRFISVGENVKYQIYDIEPDGVPYCILARLQLTPSM